MTANGYGSGEFVRHELKSGMLVDRTFEIHVSSRLHVKSTMIFPFLPTSVANLTPAQDEKVGLENFELLKVLGTGGNV